MNFKSLMKDLTIKNCIHGIKIPRILPALAMGVLVTASPGLYAHDSFLDVRAGKAVLIDGHADSGDERGYDKERAVSLIGYDSTFKPINAQFEFKDGLAYYDLKLKPALVSAHFDNGYWSNSPSEGWVRKPGSEVADATVSMYSHKYSKLFTGAIKGFDQPVGDPLEVVPLSDPSKVKAGDEFKVKVLLFGKPLIGAELLTDVHAGDESGKATTDSDGVAVFKVPSRSFAIAKITNIVELAKDPNVSSLYLSASISYFPTGGGK